MRREKRRCPWLKLSNPLYVEYHDRQWGRPEHDDVKLFECLTLEGAQAGLSWETVLNKRERYIERFSGFDPRKVARYSEKKVDSLLQDTGLIRNRLKIESTVRNAKLFLEVQKEFGSFDCYIWGFSDFQTEYGSPQSTSDYLSNNELSDRISKDLKARGFKFVGSTIIFAFMQAIGMRNDHSTDCYLYGKKLRRLLKH